jgi:gluconate 2-dehydrogenase subunit 3-like protein
MNRRTLIQLLAAAPLLATAGQAAAFRPRCFSAAEYATLCLLCEYIIPAEEGSGGAVEARVPELIDLLGAENEEYQRRIAGGIGWLDAECLDRFGAAFAKCKSEDQKAILDLIAFRASAERVPAVSQGVSFFAFLRELTLGGYFTSEIGIHYLPYLGNQVLSSFPACPPLPNDDLKLS